MKDNDSVLEYQLTNTGRPEHPDMTIEALAVDVWLLTCGCIRSESEPERPSEPALIRGYRPEAKLLPLDPPRVEVTINTAPITGRTDHFRNPARHTHGRPLVRLPIRDWYDQAVTSGIPDVARAQRRQTW